MAAPAGEGIAPPGACRRPGGLSIASVAVDDRDAVLQPAQPAAGVRVGAADAVVGDDHDDAAVAVAAQLDARSRGLRRTCATLVSASATTK